MIKFPYELKDITQDLLELLNAVNNFIQTHDAWAGDPTTPPQPTEDYWEACESLVGIWNGCSQPKICRVTDMEIALNELNAQLQEHDLSNSVDVQDSFYHAVERIKKTTALFYRTVRTPYVVESIESLADVSDSQICNMYGWVDEYGNPLIGKLSEERRNPGSIVDKNWRHPYEENRVLFQDAFNVAEKGWEPQQVTKVSSPEPHKETWQELYELGVLPEQAAKMKLVTVEEAKQSLNVASRGGLPQSDAYRDGLENLTCEELCKELDDMGVGYKTKTPKPNLIKKVRAAREVVAEQ